MCDPVTAMVVSGIGAVASAGINYAQQSAVMRDQQSANDQWVAWQRQQAADEMAKDEASRQRADAARQDTLAKVNPNAQKTDQTTEQQRLTTALTPEQIASGAAGTNAGDLLLSGQKNASPDVQGAISAKINQAAADARARIAALATIQSYGGSQYGLSNTAQRAFQQGGQDISLQSDFRKGDLAAYGVAKNVEPVKYVATPSPWGSMASSLAGIAGSAFGGGMGSGKINFGGTV